VRVALISPYSWNYPGGVLRHIEALQRELVASGHEAQVFAPVDPDDRLNARLHRGAAPQIREIPDWLTPMGRTVGVAMNGAMSSCSLSPQAASDLRRELASGGFDVVHLHEPIAPILCWDTLMSTDLPMVGTFHCYSTNRVTNNLGVMAGARRRMNRLGVRIAVSDAAAWTGTRFFGGDYRIIPNGVDLPETAPGRRFVRADAPLQIAYVGQAVTRKGLPLLLRAFEALREQVPAELTIVGANADEVEPLLLDGGRGITVLGRVTDEEKTSVLRKADLLCAPSLGGESFGMVLTEAFAQGTPVVASDIAGYVDVVNDGVDGVLVPRGDATALAEALRSLALDPARRAALARGAAASAEAYAWPQVTASVVSAYEDAIALPEPATTTEQIAVQAGLRSVTLGPPKPAQRIASIEPPLADRPGARAALARRVGVSLLGGSVLAGSVFAVDRIGPQAIVDALLGAAPTWVLAALVLMCLSMVVRAVAWHQILIASVRDLTLQRPRFRDALQGTTIGVLMSATLPARLGEPARAIVVARRLGRPREGLPTVLGTIVSQTLLNIVALVGLGAIMFASVDVFDRHQGALLAVVLAPIGIVLAVVGGPALISRSGGRESRRMGQLVQKVRQALSQVRDGLLVFRDPRRGPAAVSAQLSAWVVQWLSCYLLLVAFGLNDRAGLAAAAAVLFAVNVSAVLPATPSNLGVFQAACVFVLHKGYGISVQDALGYGIVLQAVEIATAFIMGGPALVGEGLSWRDVRMRALHATPVKLPPLPHSAPSRARPDAVELEV
jgi:phosphatidylinositol alpha-mannosyltransferase